ncbi:MAG: STAS domain-containing protein [Calditrichota bacterium]
MEVTARTLGGIKIIALTGKILSSQDTAGMHNEVRLAVEADSIKVILDLSGLDWMNSTGLGALVAANGRLTGVGGELRLACPNDTITELLHLNKLDRVFEIYPDLESAIASFR